MNHSLCVLAGYWWNRLNLAALEVIALCDTLFVFAAAKQGLVTHGGWAALLLGSTSHRQTVSTATKLGVLASLRVGAACTPGRKGVLNTSGTYVTINIVITNSKSISHLQ